MRKKLRVGLVIFVLAAVCFGLIAVIQFAAGVDSNNPDPYSWPMYQNDLRHSGYSTSPGPLGNQTLWKYPTNDTFGSEPTIVNGVLYAASAQSLYALNASTGTLLWRYDSTSSLVFADPIMSGHYVGGFSIQNSSYGGFPWIFSSPYPGIYFSPNVYNGMIYSYSLDSVCALNASTGSKIWGFLTNGTMVFTPTIDNNLVIVTYMTNNWYLNGSVYALDASTGSLAWQFTPKTQFYASPDTSPTVADGVVFVGYNNGFQYAIDEATGKLLWSGGTQIWIKAGSESGNGYAANGHVTPAAIGNSRVYFGATSNDNSSAFNVYALDQNTGAKIWVYQMSCSVSGPVVLAGDEVFLAGNDGYIYTLNAETGSEVWKYMAGNGTMASPIVAGGIVYAASNNGIFAIGGGGLSYGPDPTPKPTSKPTASPGPTPTSAPTPIASPPPMNISGPSPIPTPTATPPTSFGFEIGGNISSSQVSNVYWVTNQTATKIYFTVTGESGTFGFGNLTIAKSRIPQATTPVIYVDNIIVPEQGYTQDTNNYYVWYSVHFSTHSIVIEFNSDAAASPQATNLINGAKAIIDYQSIIYALAIASVIAVIVCVVLKVALEEKKK